MLLHTCLWLQWLLSVLSVALNWLITLHVLLIWHHLTNFYSARWKTKHLAGKHRTKWGHICSWGLFRESIWEFLYHGNPSAATPMEKVFGPQPQGRLCWKINTIWDKFDHCIIVIAYELFRLVKMISDSEPPLNYPFKIENILFDMMPGNRGNG